VISSANEPDILVTSNISISETVCPGNIVVFTCTTRGSAVISWTGDDYVGDQISFTTANMVGDTRQGSANPNTIAKLINNTLDGTPVLVSQLQINVSTVSSNQSVVCIHNSNEIRETVTFQVLTGIHIYEQISVIVSSMHVLIQDLNSIPSMLYIVCHMMTFQHAYP
jgi:hypothetical protein